MAICKEGSFEWREFGLKWLDLCERLRNEERKGKRGLLKGLFHNIFHQKIQYMAPDLYPKTVLNRDSNMPRYSNSLPIQCCDPLQVVYFFLQARADIDKAPFKLCNMTSTKIGQLCGIAIWGGGAQYWIGSHREGAA
jgi:hypothetical protein